MGSNPISRANEIFPKISIYDKDYSVLIWYAFCIVQLLTFLRMKNQNLKSDRYRKARGGYSRFLDIYCDHCGHKVLIYQKDGPGELKRLYLDRIFSPENLSRLFNLQIKKVSNLTCSKCDSLLGTAYIHSKEERPASRLFSLALQKKITP